MSYQFRDEYTGKVRSVSIWQGIKEGCVSVLESADCARVPHGVSLQFHGSETTRTSPDEGRPDANHYRCKSEYHLLWAKDVWVDEKYFARDKRNKNGLDHRCKTCEAIRWQLQTAAAEGKIEGVMSDKIKEIAVKENGSTG